MLSVFSEMEVAWMEIDGKVVFLAYPPKDHLYNCFHKEDVDTENAALPFIKHQFREFLKTQAFPSRCSQF